MLLEGPAGKTDPIFLAKKKKKKYFHRLLLGEFHAKQGAFGSSGLQRKYWMSENFFFSSILDCYIISSSYLFL